MKPKNESPQALINEKIKFDKLQLISSDGRNEGTVLRDHALKLARSENLDLVLIAEKGGEGLPVAKIMDYGKALYAKKKQLAESKKHQKVIQVKEVKLRPKIGEHDFQTKLTQAADFLKDGKHVKVTLMFRGREAAMSTDLGNQLFERFDKGLEEIGLTKIAQEKDAKTPSLWSRIYYLKK